MNLSMIAATLFLGLAAGIWFVTHQAFEDGLHTPATVEKRDRLPGDPPPRSDMQATPTPTGAQALAPQNASTDGRILERRGNWSILCEPLAIGAPGCVLLQDINLTQTGQRIARLGIGPKPGDGALNATVVVSINARFRNMVGLTIDDTPIAEGPFTSCDETSCQAFLQLRPDAPDMMRRGQRGMIHLETEDGTPVRLAISLSGFAASWDRMAQLSR